MAQIEGAYYHEKLDGTVYEIALYDSVEDVGDCYFECGYNGKSAYAAATEDKTSDAYKNCGTPATFKRKDGTEFWLLTEPYVNNYLNILGDIIVDSSSQSILLSDYISTNAVKWQVTNEPSWLSGGDMDNGSIDYMDFNANTSTSSRTATILVTATFADGSTMTATITVTQAGVEVGNVNFSITATPTDAIITINGEITSSVTVVIGTEVTWSVAAIGYETQSGSLTVVRTTAIIVTLTALETGGGSAITTVTLKIKLYGPTSAILYLSSAEDFSSEVGTIITNDSKLIVTPGTYLWKATASGYTDQSGTITIGSSGAVLDIVMGEVLAS